MNEPKQQNMPEPLNAPRQQNGKTGGFGRELYGLLHDLIYIVAAVTVVFVFFVRLIGVNGSSMLPTLHDGDYVLLESNLFYTNIKQGDIVVLQKLSYDDQPIVKRVIATEGQTVDIDFVNGIVYVDGVALQEDYIFAPTYLSYEEYNAAMEYPVTLGEGQLWVMGDNRNDSADSRLNRIGIIDEREVLGKVLAEVWPLSRLRLVS